ncbi:MAG: pantetheine-phosphate adenylyltransferase [Anaerolineae bacterium]|nr:pantetheine-phosphate adenylyltransferase [Anaerolineae bacterium]MDQ7034829.1 pantetheine-phosphate adenylyltransferase [Anaerolineae bacterium]
MSRIGIYPASLDPIHFGHIDIARRSARIFDEIIVAIYATPKKNLLFSVDERVELAEQVFQDDNNIRVAKFSGLVVNYARSMGAMALIRGLRLFGDFEYEFRMGLANKSLAPDIETVAILADVKFIHISSSTVREIAELGGSVSRLVPPHIEAALKTRFGYD